MKRTWTGLFAPDWYRGSTEPDLSPFRPTDYMTQLEGLDFFRQRPELRVIWEFDSDEGELQGLSFENVAEIARSGFRVITPFANGKLIVHSPIALQAGTFHFGIMHTVLFDSNVYNLLVRFAEGSAAIPSSEAAATRALLEWLIVRKYDYQLMPYAIEMLPKGAR